MTTAHRPTFDPAKGKETDVGSILHSRMLPAHTKLKFRQPGQGADADANVNAHANADAQSRLLLKEQLLSKENEHLNKIGQPVNKRPLESDDIDDEDTEVKKRQVLMDNLAVDGDSSSDSENENGHQNENDDEDNDSESDDEESLLMAELQKIKNERAESQRIQQEEAARLAQDAREQEIAFGNPLLNEANNFKVKRSWTEEVVFKNQASTASGAKSSFVNDMIRSDFHRKFIKKYIQ